MSNFESIPLNEVKLSKADDPEMIANKEYARRVYTNDGATIVHYMTVLNKDNISYISNCIMHRDIYADYYKFISRPVVDSVPQWKAVRNYTGQKKKKKEDEEVVYCTLKSYTSLIASRHFYTEAAKEKKVREKETPFLESINYEALKSCDVLVDEGEDPDSKIVLRKKAARIALEQLTEIDRLIITYLVIESRNNIEAYEMLSSYINPRNSNGQSTDEVKNNKSKYQKSTDISVKKGRALERLIAISHDIMKQSREGLYDLHFYYDATIYFSSQSVLLDDELRNSLQLGFEKLPEIAKTILVSRLKDKHSPVKVFEVIRKKYPELKGTYHSSLTKEAKINLINQAMAKALKLWENFCPSNIL